MHNPDHHQHIEVVIMDGITLLAGALALTSSTLTIPVGTVTGNVQVRDADGGETATGAPDGKFLVGTGASLRGTTDGGPNGFLLTGTFDFEINFEEGGGWEEFLTYCIEPELDIGFDNSPSERGGMTYQLIPLTLASGFTAQEAIWAEILWSNAFDTSTTGTAEAGAFQSILWEFAQDDNFDLLADNTRLNPLNSLTAQAAAIADAWLLNITSGLWTSRTPLLALHSEFSQDLIVPVPAPGALGVAMGIGAVGASRRRRR
jgi:hypothetical protein